VNAPGSWPPKRAAWREKITKFLSRVSAVFRTPFIGLPIIAWSYFVIAYIALPNSVWSGNLPDPDDYMYLLQTLDLLHGQSWFDNVQHRMDPSSGVPIHFTRFAQLPIAGMISLFKLLGYTPRGAALLTSFLLPAVYLGVFFGVVRKVAEQYVSAKWSRLSAFIALFAVTLMVKFSPGQVDHHGLEAILTFAALGFVTAMLSQPQRLRWPIAAGGILALAVAVALETLPWMALISAIVGLWTAISGKPAAKKAGAAYGLSLCGFGALLLVLTRPASTILTPDVLTYSVVYVCLMAGIAVSLWGAALSSRLNPRSLRLAYSGSIAFALGVLFLKQFPDLLAGPYGAMDPHLAELFFKNVEEAVPATTRLSTFRLIQTSLMPVMAFVVSLWALRSTSGSRRWNWILLTTLLAAATALTWFYQFRVFIYAQAFSIIPLVLLAEKGWGWIGDNLKGRGRFCAEIGLVLLVGPLTTVLLPALADSRSFNKGVLLFIAQDNNDGCDMRRALKVLNSPPYGERQLKLMNMVNQGPGLLFYTPHTVMSAPYHTNVRGNLEATKFFSTTDAAKAEEIARQYGIDMVVACKYVPVMYLKDGVRKSDGDSSRFAPNDSFTAKLVEGKVPEWLKEVPVPQPSKIALFEVLPKRDARK
jgi:hypothetical protein